MNNDYDKIDSLMFKYFENKQVPNSITNGINNAMYSKKYKKYKIILYIKKIIITLLGLFTITGSIVFAKDIKYFVENLAENIFANYNNGISTAITNGYIEDSDTEYIKSNHVEIQIDKVTMDKYNLGIVFKIKFDSNTYLDNLYNVSLKNLIIMDENNNIIFSEYENKEEFIQYCKDNNLNPGTYGIGCANTAANGKITKKENNEITYSFYTTSENFPDSKNLNIKFNKIYLLNDKIYDENTNEILNNHYTTIEGDWELNLSLNDLKNKQEEINYKVFNINDDKTIITKATLSMSNMQLELVTNSNKIDFEKLKQRKNINVSDIIPFHDIYLETSDGKRFYQSNSGNNGYTTVEDGKIKYYTFFDYTYFDKTEIIKIVLTTNKNQELIIKLNTNI